MQKKIKIDSLELIYQTILVPFESFGKDRLFSFFEDKEKIKHLFLKLEEKVQNKNCVLDDVDISLLIKIFIIARDIIDPVEFQTITSYSWDHSTKVFFELIDLLA